MRCAPVLLVLAACQTDPLDCPVTTPRAAPTADTESVVQGNTEFAAAAYRSVAQVEGNRFLAPLSISAVMSMVLAGADGETAAQMRDVLGLGVDDSVHHQQLGGLLADLGRSDVCLGTDLTVASGLFMQQGHPFEQPFLDTVQDAYDPLTQVVDFNADGRETVNQWAAEQTADRVQELLGPDSLGPNPLLVLANATVFEGTWKTEFDAQGTQGGSFHRDDGTTVEVPMMSQSGSFRTGRGADYELLELPYLGDETALVVVLPSEDLTLAELEADMTGLTLSGWVDDLASAQEVEVEMPRFAFGDSIAVDDVLIGLGMVDVFDPAVADLSRMTDASAYLSHAVQQTWVSVDEEGTVAVEATAAVANARSSAGFIALDRPFLFFVRDTVTGTVLFIGRVADPAAASL